MPAILSILSLLIVIGIFAGLWVASAVVCLLGYFTKKRWLKWIGGIPLAGLSVVGIAAVGLFLWSLYASHSPPHVFKESFGFAPMTTIQFRSGYWSVFADSGVAELDFVADANTIQRIIDTGFVAISMEDYKYYKEIDGNPTRFFKKDPFGKNFSSDVALLAVNDDTGHVYFHWTGID